MIMTWSSPRPSIGNSHSIWQKIWFGILGDKASYGVPITWTFQLNSWLYLLLAHKWMSFIVKPIRREVDIFFGFSWRDWSATIIPGVIYGVAPLRQAGYTLSEAIPRCVLLLSWLVAYIYFFDLSNQIIGVEEDKINKPDRPIPSGKVTLEGAKRRWLFATSFYLALIAVEPNIWAETINWVLTTAFLCLTPYSRHWMGKNVIAMTTGTWSLLSAIWKCIDPVTPTNHWWNICFSMWVGLIINCQDLRDIKGDLVMNRQTMPIAFGETKSRYIIAFILVPAATFFLWVGDVLKPAPLTNYAMALILAVRVLRGGGVRADHKAYMFFTYMFCIILMTESLKQEQLEARAIEWLKKFALSVVNVKSVL